MAIATERQVNALYKKKENRTKSGNVLYEEGYGIYLRARNVRDRGIIALRADRVLRESGISPDDPQYDLAVSLVERGFDKVEIQAQLGVAAARQAPSKFVGPGQRVVDEITAAAVAFPELPSQTSLNDSVAKTFLAEKKKELGDKFPKDGVEFINVQLNEIEPALWAQLNEASKRKILNDIMDNQDDPTTGSQWNASLRKRLQK